MRSSVLAEHSSIFFPLIPDLFIALYFFVHYCDTIYYTQESNMHPSHSRVHIIPVELYLLHSIFRGEVTIFHGKIHSALHVLSTNQRPLRICLSPDTPTSTKIVKVYIARVGISWDATFYQTCSEKL